MKLCLYISPHTHTPLTHLSHLTTHHNCQAEQRKAEKKILETEKRATDIRQMKVRNAESARRKETAKSSGNQQQQRNQQFLAMERAKQRDQKRVRVSA